MKVVMNGTSGTLVMKGEDFANAVFVPDEPQPAPTAPSEPATDPAVRGPAA